MRPQRYDFASDNSAGVHPLAAAAMAAANTGAVADKAGSTVRVARVLTMTLLSPPGVAAAESSAPTRRVE